MFELSKLVVMISIRGSCSFYKFLSWMILNSLLELEQSTNNGFLDQKQALTWIQANLAHFGGDPDRIAIVGESGGTSVLLHLISLASRECI